MCPGREQTKKNEFANGNFKVHKENSSCEKPTTNSKHKIIHFYFGNGNNKAI